MSDLSPHAAAFSPAAHDDYDDDFDDDSFEDDAPQQLSPISEAVPPSTPMSPRDRRHERARGVHPTMAREGGRGRRGHARRRSIEEAHRPTILPPAPVRTMQIEAATPPGPRREASSCGTSCRSYERSLLCIPVSQDESPRVAQLLREKETLLEEVAARDGP